MASNPSFQAIDFSIDADRRPSGMVFRDKTLRLSSTPERRHSRRDTLKKRASLVVRRGRQDQRIPCLILDTSPGGFRIRGAFQLKRGQAVEVIVDEYPSNLVCNVVWVGKPGSKHAGEVGLKAVSS